MSAYWMTLLAGCGSGSYEHPSARGPRRGQPHPRARRQKHVQREWRLRSGAGHPGRVPRACTGWLEKVPQQVVGEAGGVSNSSHNPSNDTFSTPSLDPRPVTGIENYTHRGTRRIWMFFCDEIGRPPRVAGL